MRIISQDERTSLEFSQVTLVIDECKDNQYLCEIIAKGQDYRTTTIAVYDKNEVDQRFWDIHKAYENGGRVYRMPEI